jgi:hypothetical protein
MNNRYRYSSDMPTSAPPAALSGDDHHQVELASARAQIRASHHEPRRRLSGTVRLVVSIFVEARLENERLSERMRVAR